MNYLSVFSLQHGTTKASEFFNLQEFYTKYIYPELERKNGKGSMFHLLLQISFKMIWRNIEQWEEEN